MEIRKIKIINFKCWDKIRYQTNRINIIVGPNNTGKTSLLEALGLSLTAVYGERDLFFRNIIYELQDKYGPFIRYIIKKNAVKTEIEAEAGDNTVKTVIYGYDRGHPPNSEIIELLFRFFKSQSENMGIRYGLHRPNNEKKRNTGGSGNGESDEFSQILVNTVLDHPGIIIEQFRNDKRVGIFMIPERRVRAKPVRFHNVKTWREPIWRFVLNKIISMRYYVLFRDVKKERGHPKGYFYYDPYRKMDFGNIYKKAVKNGRIENILKRLKGTLAGIKDIRMVEDNVYIFSENGDLPVRLMGDGLKNLLKTVFPILILGRGVILMEEPDISLHPGYMDILARIITENCDNIQFFITTHNIDLIGLIIEAAEKKGIIDKVTVLRMHYKDMLKKIMIEPINGKDASELTEIEYDLRIT